MLDSSGLSPNYIAKTPIVVARYTTKTSNESFQLPSPPPTIPATTTPKSKAKMYVDLSADVTLAGIIWQCSQLCVG